MAEYLQPDSCMTQPGKDMVLLVAQEYPIPMLSRASGLGLHGSGLKLHVYLMKPKTCETTQAL